MLQELAYTNLVYVGIGDPLAQYRYIRVGHM